MNQTDLQGDTERALRVLTCEHCSANVPVNAEGKHILHSYNAHGSYETLEDCYSKHAELLPLFNAGIAGAYAAAAKHWPIVCKFEYTGCNCGWQVSDKNTMAALDQWRQHILALTPADARLAQSWRCFFCDEVFTDKNLAEEHFGSDEHEVSIPACVDPLRTDENKRHAEVHAMRQEIKRVEGERDELEIDSDNLHAMQNELERLFGDGVTTAHHAWLRLEAAQNLAEAYREKLDTLSAAIASAEARARLEALKEFRDKHDLGERLCVIDGSKYYDYASVGSNYSEKILNKMISAEETKLAAARTPDSTKEPE